MLTKKKLINDLLNYYLCYVPCILNIISILVFIDCNSLMIAYCCFTVFLFRISNIPDFKWKNHIFFFDLRKAIMNKKILLMRFAVFVWAICIIYMAIISEGVSFVCGAYCLNSEIMYRFFHGMSYPIAIYALFISVFRFDNLD